MGLRAAMRVLTDDQLLAVHDNAQKHVADRLKTGHTSILAGYARQARASEREIIARGRYGDARNHAPNPAVRR